VVGALALSGCGRTGARETVGAVTERFYAAVQHGDGRTACAQLSPDTRMQLESQEGHACRRAVTQLQLHGGALRRVQVFLTNAEADLSSGETAFLDHGAQGWRLSAVGCKPQGPPADEPYQCEVQD
jgi:hypothetical protein